MKIIMLIAGAMLETKERERDWEGQRDRELC